MVFSAVVNQSYIFQCTIKLLMWLYIFSNKFKKMEIIVELALKIEKIQDRLPLKILIRYATKNYKIHIC